MYRMADDRKVWNKLMVGFYDQKQGIDKILSGLVAIFGVRFKKKFGAVVDTLQKFSFW